MTPSRGQRPESTRSEPFTSDDMSTHDDVEHRARHTAPGEQIEVREVDTEERDGAWFAIRMPISSTIEARDGKAFTRDRLEGWERQIDQGTVPVFADHGKNSDVAASRYSAFGKFGYYENAELTERNSGVDLVADTVVLDPAALPEETGDYRKHLAILKAQAEAGMPITASVGWKEDTGDRDVPGDSDLIEGSIVGVPSDPRADSTASAEPAAMARAVSAATDGFDVETFERELRKLERAEYEINGETVTIDPPDAVVNAATVALAKDDELEPDCGTGEGRRSARMIADDDVGPERIEDIAAYLTSHEEDVTADGPPSDWSDEEWQDCGNLQYALWGGTGTGTGLEWAQETANAVAEAKGEELPYDRQMSDDTTESGEQPDDTNEEQDGMDADEYRQSMLEMQRSQTEMLETLADAIRQDGEDEDGDGDDDDEEDDDMDEESADTGDERMVELGGEEMSAREAVENLREQLDDDPEPEDPETQDRGEAEDEDSEETETGGFGFAAMEE